MSEKLGPAPNLPIGQQLLMIFSYLSAFLYVWIIVVIVKYRRKYNSLQSPFYHLLMNQAFTDLIMFLVMEVILRPRKYRFFAVPIYSLEVDAFYPRFSYFCFVATRSAMFLGYVPFALNRFTIFYRPTLYQKIWSHRTTTVCAVLQWLFPLIFNIYAFFLVKSSINFHLLPNGVLQSLTDQYIAKLPPSIAKSEVRLLICSAVTFIPMILDAVRNVAQIACEHFFGYRDVFLISAELLYYTIEIASVTQPWAILLTNDMIRKLLFGEKRIKRKSIGTVAAVKSFKSTSVVDAMMKPRSSTVAVKSTM